MGAKAFARYLYSSVPGLALARFALKDVAAVYSSKPEFAGLKLLGIEGGLIVDIGANRGQSVAAFRRLAPLSRIFAFEPEPRSAARLLSRYQGDAMVTVHACALAEQSKAMTLFIPTYGRWNCDGMAALDRREATEWLHNPGRMLWFNPGKLTVAEHIIECRTLDSLKLSPRLIKLHAQGAEFSILKGAEHTIRNHRPALMCAFPQMATTELLAGWGYAPHIYLDRRFKPGVAPPDTTFTWYLADEHRRHLPRNTHPPAS